MRIGTRITISVNEERTHSFFSAVLPRNKHNYMHIKNESFFTCANISMTVLLCPATYRKPNKEMTILIILQVNI